MTLPSLTLLDAIGISFFVIVWGGYALLVDHGPLSRHTLSSAMNRQRLTWVRMMQAREVRIADTNILAGLQQGTAFFASASALAIGGCLAVLGSSEAVATVIDDLAPGGDRNSVPFDVKVVGLTVIFVYAFFKFSWGYRLFNYASILIGALPAPTAAGTPATELAIARASLFLRLGGRNFNRGQRAFLFSIAYLGWLIDPWLLIAGASIVLAVLVHRQFWSPPARIVRDDAVSGPR